MNRRIQKTLPSVLYLICLYSAFTLILNFFGVWGFTYYVKTFLVGVLIVCGYLAAYLTARSKNGLPERRKIIFYHIVAFFAVYIFVLIDFTLIDESLSRNVFNILGGFETSFSEYVKRSTNFIPFKTVKLFISAYKYKSLPMISVAENIAGNFFVLMPLAFFLPCLSRFFDGWWKISAALILTVSAVEILQLCLRTGACDIDDLILNVCGAWVCYKILNLRPISNALSKMTFGVWQGAKKHPENGREERA